jgi:hypothetical protein
VRVRYLALVILAVVIGVVGWRVGRPGEVPARPAATAAADSAAGAERSAPPTAPASPRALPPSPHLRRITPDERRQLAAQIAAARARRASSGSAAAGSADGAAPERRIAVEQVSVPIKSALEEAIPILAECYARTGKRQPRPAVMMTLIGDPSVGTLIDATDMFDHEHKPLEPELDRCLRDAFATMQLPPLEEGDKLDLQYSFRFDD